MIITDLAATQAIGVALAEGIEAQHWPACLLLFRGPLGAGKTTLIRALLGALGVTGTVRSPSFTLIEGYPLAATTVQHVDLYRLNDPAELEDLGFADLLNGRDICLVEWPERAPRLTAQADLLVDLEPLGLLRRVDWQARTPLGSRLSARLPV
ncbi:MAG: tRNA (adenosine(37)-N6)-threonylcarbamoyltransferase complex ATPase subunit type 1 TsaE [Gammaproteobacteria bacterium]|nr:tRNA (adenosine(37)-N6)-threonylcarbamoyltransferase complex ATPase subunit type 1 TsaE [Gammaproteobacteria bacterium]